MKAMFQITLIFLSCLVQTAISQDEESDVRESFTYYLPFVESTFSGDWTFRLEMTTLGNDPFEVRIQGMGHQGGLLFQTTEQYEPYQIVTWQSGVEQSKQRLQSLIVTSDAELAGILWMKHEADGLLNAVSTLLDGSADRLVLPHIPNDRYSWKTTAAVVGVDAGQTSGSLEFAYVNESGFQRNLSLRSSIEDGVWYTGSPYHKIPIGSAEEEETALWGAVYTGSETFHLAGVQNFVRLSDDAPLSCALELMPGEGRSHAMVGLSSDEELGFSDWIALTNPNQEPVTLTLTLSYLPDVVAEDESDESTEPPSGPLTQTAVQTMTLAPLTRSVHILFGDLFREVKGTPYILSYSASAQADPESTEEPVAMPIFAIHLQADSSITRLGAHHFTDKVGRFGQAWFDLSGTETDIDIYNPGELQTFASVTLTDHLGRSLLFAERIEIEPGAAHFGLGSELVRAYIDAKGEELDFDASEPIRVTIALQRGDGFFTKVTGKARDAMGMITDIGIVDGAVTTPPTDNPPF
jgi:hypothetical protein